MVLFVCLFACLFFMKTVAALFLSLEKGKKISKAEETQVRQWSSRDSE